MKKSKRKALVFEAGRSPASFRAFGQDGFGPGKIISLDFLGSVFYQEKTNADAAGTAFKKTAGWTGSENSLGGAADTTYGKAPGPKGKLIKTTSVPGWANSSPTLSFFSSGTSYEIKLIGTTPAVYPDYFGISRFDVRTWTKPFQPGILYVSNLDIETNIPVTNEIIYITKLDFTEVTITTSEVCGEVELGYDYGYNSGSEKDNEIAGTGNIYGTEWRVLDVRIGRWWSNDKIVKPWESPYAGFANNPIYYSDPLGLDPTKPISNPQQGDRNAETGATYDNDLGWVLPEAEITADGEGGNNTTAGNVTGAAGGILGGLTLDFMIRDKVDYRNKYYNPNHDVIKNAWKSGKITNAEYSMSRYQLQAETKAMYKSAISKAIGETPPFGKPLWQQKALAERIASGNTPMPKNAGTTRASTTKIATQTSTKIIGRSLVVVSASMSIHTIVTAEDKAKAVTTEVSGWVGAWGMAAVGTTWGAAIGGPFAPVTGVIGGIVGGGIGYFTAVEISGAVYDTIKEE